MSSNGRFIFVVIDPDAVTPDRKLRETYRQSGAYRVGDPRRLWDLPYYGGLVLLASDGVHAVVINAGPSLSPESPRGDVAIEFFARGVSLKRHTVDQLIGPTIPYSAMTVSHYGWYRHAAFYKDEAEMVVWSLGSSHRFVVATGNLVTSERNR